jgi:hypothetical protein
MDGLLDKIRGADDVRKVAYDVEDWGVTVYFVTPTSTAYFEYQQFMVAKRREANQAGRDTLSAEQSAEVAQAYLSMVVCDESGNRIFDSEEGMEVLRAKSGPVITNLWLTAQDMLKDPMAGGDDGVEDFPETPA